MSNHKKLVLDHVQVYNRYIYVYTQPKDKIPISYPLSHAQPRTVKDAHRNHLDPAHLSIATNHTSIMMDNNHVLCIYNRLHVSPHGDDDVRNKDEHERVLREAKISCDTVHISDRSFSNGDIIVLREGNNIIQNASVLYRLVTKSLICDILSGGDFYKTNDPRVHGNNIRFFLGFNSRPQRKPMFYKKGNKRYLLPDIHKKGEHLLDNMDENLKSNFGKLLKECENAVRRQHPDAFCDVFRNDFWRKLWSEIHWPNLCLSWEFVDISVKLPSQNMKCHLDYMNDYRTGYTYCAVISSVVDINGVLHRLTIIMASRKICGGVIDSIKKGIP